MNRLALIGNGSHLAHCLKIGRNDFIKWYLDMSLVITRKGFKRIYRNNSLTAFTQSNHIFFGTDYPFALADIVANFTLGLDKYRHAEIAFGTKISHKNALIHFRNLLNCTSKRLVNHRDYPGVYFKIEKAQGGFLCFLPTQESFQSNFSPISFILKVILI